MKVAQPEAPVPAMMGDTDVARIARDVGAPSPAAEETSDPGKSPAEVLKQVGAAAAREDPKQHVITEADLGRTLGDLAFEIDAGSLPPMSEAQQAMLSQLLFEKGWTEKVIALPLGFRVALRSSSVKLASEVKKCLRVETDKAQAAAREAAAREADPPEADSSTRGRGSRVPLGAITNQEFMLLTNRIVVAAQLTRLGDQATWDPDQPFDTEEALSQRVHFVMQGAYDGAGLPAVLLDRLALELNAFNEEIGHLLSGKYLARF